MTRALMKLTLAAMSVFALLPFAANAADLEAGKKFATDVCAACHGVDGNAQNPDYPKIGGQHADYLAKTLRDYQSGVRNNAIMKGFATMLKAADIEDVSAWYAHQKQVLSHRK